LSMRFAVFVGGARPLPTTVDGGAVILVDYRGCWFEISSRLSVISVDMCGFAVSRVLWFFGRGNFGWCCGREKAEAPGRVLWTRIVSDSGLIARILMNFLPCQYPIICARLPLIYILYFLACGGGNWGFSRFRDAGYYVVSTSRHAAR
jgi:hypothetical protein